MLREKNSTRLLSELVNYLAAHAQDDDPHVPSLIELKSKLGVSVASLREQLEVARALGLVEVKPRTGIRRLPYTFRPAVMQSLAYSVTIDPEHFQHFSDLRNHLEAAYWRQAVAALLPEDHNYMANLVSRALEKLGGFPVQIPHYEHRELHLGIYRRLDNPFVVGILEAYWEMYEAVGLDVYTDFNYIQKVWDYHSQMVQAIIAGDAEKGYHAMIEHMDLIYLRTNIAAHE